MSKRNDIELLADIQEAVQRILSYCRDISYEKFMQETKNQDAVIRNLEIIGEAVKNISPEIKDKNPDVAWKDFAKVRDKLIHHYFGVNFDIVWDIIDQSLPEFLDQIEAILKSR